MVKRGLSAERTFVVKDKDYLNPIKRAELEKQVKSMEFNAKNIDNVIDSKKTWLYNPKCTNVSEIRKQISRTKKTIAKRTPPETDTKTRNVLFKRAKALESMIKEGLPTKDEMMGKRLIGSDNKPYVVTNECAIKKHMEWTTRQAGNVREWRQIMRILEPLDPNIANVERLRKGH